MWKFVIICLALSTTVLGRSVDFEPRLKLPLKELKTSADRIREHGYPAESHFVETNDGYVLNLFRIPYSPKLKNKNIQKPVVFLQHGLFSCSDCFLLNGPEDGISFLFADAGYDVWLGNARGNIYSRNNTKVSLNHPKFWQFSWHEIGVTDIPTSIDYVLKLTGEDKVHYVGHSQGTTVFFVMTSMRPEYNEMIKTAHMLAPPIFMGNASEGLISLLSGSVGEPGTITTLLSDQEFLPSNPQIQRVLDTACGGQPRFPKYCKTLFLLWGGTDQVNLNETLLPQLAETHPAGISTNQGIHFIQLHRSNKFRQYDFGVKKNFKRYNAGEPPDYPLEKITSNMFIYYGLSDTSANKQDILRLLDILPNIQLFYEVPDPSWGHDDFIFAMQVKEEINDKIIGYCNSYEEGFQ